jgi:hypothetical protein
MASAGLLKVLHSGIQDERLLGSTPQPYSKAFLKTGRFTTEWYRIDFDNRPAFGQTATATLPRRGHLISRAFLVTQMPDLSIQQQQARSWCSTNDKSFAGPTIGWTNSIGHALVASAQLNIGAAPIENLDGRLMELMDEFNTPLEKLTVVNRLLGRYDSNYRPSPGTGPQQYITPLPFWFSRGDPSAALPIDAITTDLVQLNVTFNSVSNLYNTTSRQLTADGKQTLGPLQNAPFYYLNPITGTPVFGLNGNPSHSVLASQIPAITMPSSYTLGTDTYLLLEYVYLDKPEANRLRLGDLSYQIPQHYALPPFETKGASSARVPIRIPNPVKELFFFVHRTDADLLNAPFLATRDLSGLFIADISGVGPIAPWWPDASGLNTTSLLPLVPAFSSTDSEPLQSFALVYEGKYPRYATDAPALFRSILPSMEKRKTPWHNKYYYVLPFGTHHDFFGVTQHCGEANFDRLSRVELQMQFRPGRGCTGTHGIPSYTIYVWGESMNVLRVYGGRAGLLFNYAANSASAGSWNTAVGPTNTPSSC